MYGDEGIDLLIRSLRTEGASPRRLRARLVGGASVTTTSVFNVGERNITAARRKLWTSRIPVDAEDVGGKIARTVHMRLDDGSVLVKSPSRPDLILRPI